MRTLSSLFSEADPTNLRFVKNVYVVASEGNADYGTLTIESSDFVQVTIHFMDYMGFVPETIDDYQLRMIPRFVELCIEKGLFFCHMNDASREQMAAELGMVRALNDIINASICF